ncbi:MAG: DUF3307 domain-containing protein [Planctomycetaceae bacterium]|nr:MAG: DUF3307 domain-containing protein [Planctomycetaceae bacterium]
MPDFSMSSAAVVVLMGLVAGHLMIDFAFQTDNNVRLKQQFRGWACAKHGFMHAAVAYCLSGLWLVWQIPVVILLVPVRLRERRTLRRTTGTNAHPSVCADVPPFARLWLAWVKSTPPLLVTSGQPAVRLFFGAGGIAKHQKNYRLP